ncbi:MAG TPA: tetratricopeptide repeat protein [Bacteroidales bacterium]|nr:tetratricopeptide repeat protein [Bacteroidales bacterium]
MNQKKTFLKFAGLILIAAFFAGCNSLNKMAKNFESITYEVTPEVLESKGGIVNFTVKGTMPAKFFNKKAAVLFQPTIEYEGGQLELRPLVLKGESVSGEGITISYAEGGSFTYTESFSFTKEMKASELIVTSVAFLTKDPIAAGMTFEDARGMKKSVILGEKKIADGIICTSHKIKIENEVREIVEVGEANPVRDANGNIDLSAYQVKEESKVDLLGLAPHGYEKVTLASKNATIYFAKNKHNYDTNLEWNKKYNVTDLLEQVNNFVRQGWEIKDVVINGWASPEGEETFNDGLSERRANTAADILYKAFDRIAKEKDTKVTYKNAKNDLNFKMAGNGPDWNSFVTKVEASNIQDKQPILNVVRSSKPEQREEEIRNMILIFPELESEILPAQRRAEITVTCYEPKKTDDEIARLATTRPAELSQAELLYAATLTQDWTTKYNIYKAAANHFDNSWEAQNNAGYMALKLGKTSEARDYFEKAEKLNPNNGIIANNIGVVYAIENNFAEAEKYFNNANRMGVDNNYNLGLVALSKADYKGALSKFSGVNCNYNMALAQLIDGNTSDAASNLECARKNGDTYYLLAVVGARTNNQTMMLNNLEKAIRVDDKYKAEAKIDREFIKYFNLTEFMELVK